MRDVPEFDFILAADPDPAFTWVATDGSDQTVSVYFDVTSEGVEMCVQTDTCGRGGTVTTQPIPAAAFGAFVRAAQAAQVEAVMHQQSFVGGCR